MGGGGGGRLLTFSAFSMGAYSRWALIRGWALIRINTVSKLRFFNFPLKKILPHVQRQAVLQHSSVIRKASFLKFSTGLWNSDLVFMHFLLRYKRLNRIQRRTKREAVRYSRTVLFTVLCIIIA